MEEGPIKEYKPYLFHKKHKTNSIKIIIKLTAIIQKKI